jgi:hypothetical protein
MFKYYYSASALKMQNKKLKRYEKEIIVHLDKWMTAKKRIITGSYLGR